MVNSVRLILVSVRDSGAQVRIITTDLLAIDALGFAGAEVVWLKETSLQACRM